MPTTNEDVLLESLIALSQLAMRETGAAGYVIYRRNLELGILVQLQAFGARVADLATGVSLPAFAVTNDSYGLTFVFRGKTIPQHAREVLDQISQVASSLLRLSLLPVRYAELAEEAAELEAQLICSKIRDRARGLIRRPPVSGFAVEALASFSETILRPRQSETMLEQLAAASREAMQERTLTAQAKAVLESDYGMSEEQAHSHLLLTSRQSRRPVKDVALDYISKRSEIA